MKIFFRLYLHFQSNQISQCSHIQNCTPSLRGTRRTFPYGNNNFEWIFLANKQSHSIDVFSKPRSFLIVPDGVILNGWASPSTWSKRNMFNLPNVFLQSHFPVVEIAYSLNLKMAVLEFKKKISMIFMVTWFQDDPENEHVIMKMSLQN